LTSATLSIFDRQNSSNKLQMKIENLTLCLVFLSSNSMSFDFFKNFLFTFCKMGARQLFLVLSLNQSEYFYE
jgi:hypothetical protein